jgi:Derlin-2/3
LPHRKVTEMRRPVAGVGSGDSISDWYKELPLVTKLFLTGTLLTGALASFNMINPMSLACIWPLIINKFHFWRLFTPFIFAGSFSFNFAMHLYVLYENCRRYEQNPFNTGGGGNSADVLFMVLFAMGVLNIAAYFLEIPFMSEPLLYVIMYAWSRREPEAGLSMFGFKFKALYCPWVYVAIRILMGGSATLPLVGIAVGHVYYFLIEVLPMTHGYDLLRTPEFCVQAVRMYTGVTGGGPGGSPYVAVQAPAARVGAPGAAAGAGAGAGAQGGFPSMGAGYQWGRGRTLGTN